MDWNTAGPAAIIGAFVATLGVFAAEMWIKPQLARWRVASILNIEIRLNVRLIDLVIQHRTNNPELVSESFQLSVRGWDAAANELHYLPEHALRPLLLQYNQFREVNELVAAHSRKGDLILQASEGPQALALFGEFQKESALFGDLVVKTRAQCERTLPHLAQVLANRFYGESVRSLKSVAVFL